MSKGKHGHKNNEWETLLSRAEVDRIKTFDQSIVEAKKYLSVGNTQRMAVAAIADRVVKLGRGNKRKELDEEHNMTSFAHAIGISPGTLWDWVEAYRFVEKNLPPETIEVNYPAIRNMRTFKKRSPQEDEVELYKAFASGKDPRCKLVDIEKRLRSVVVFVEKNGTKYFRPQDFGLLVKLSDLVQAEVDGQTSEQRAGARLTKAAPRLLDCVKFFVEEYEKKRLVPHGKSRQSYKIPLRSARRTIAQAEEKAKA